MLLIKAYILVPLVVLLLVPFLKVRGKGIVVFAAVVINALLSGYFAVHTLMGQPFEFILQGSSITGNIPLRIDALSGWFILIINFVFITGGFYGLFYMKTYREQTNNLSLHAIVFVLIQSALISLCAIQNGLVFLIAWEMMTLSAFLTVIFEHEKITTLNAGINYLIQSHIAIVFLMLGFIWVAFKTGSYDFTAITQYTAEHPGPASLMLFLCFFIGFAFKAGFVPFHTWLPYAHPAAPSHVSGIMSGVLIKIGIFGILRWLLIMKLEFTTIGYIILLISVITGLYGVMLAITQHNLKRLLAYHSVENIGIIGMGIGLGCIGIGSGMPVLATLGFAGALLHTLNHALFKSLLFYTAGIVYQATHTMNIEQLGGLIKKMPQTAILFLIAALAICGIPPFNGFISEFIIYSGLFGAMQNALLVPLMVIIFSILGLVLIGGLAMICFTKAFGIVFLGTPRLTFAHPVKDAPFIQLAPLYLIVALILSIGLFPQGFLSLLSQPLSLFTGQPMEPLLSLSPLNTMPLISRIMMGFIVFIVLVYLLKKTVLRNRQTTVAPTWGCGYNAPAPRLQYTASSFVRSYMKLFGAFLLIIRKEKKLHGIFPSGSSYESHPYDKVEKWIIDNPIHWYRTALHRFTFLQNGKLQLYILYGIIFITSVIAIPLFYEKIIAFVKLLKLI